MSSDNTNTAIKLVEDESCDSFNTRPDVFDYLDHREFIRDWFSYLKERKGLSLRKFANVSGVSASFLTLVINGKRPLSEKAFNKMLPHLFLGKYEQKYLSKLRLMELSSNTKKGSEAVFNLRKHKKFRQKNHKENETFNYLTHWYHIAIRELSADPDFRDDPKWIQKNLNFHVSLQEIRDALSFLEENEFLVRNKKDHLVAVDKKVFCTKNIFKHSVRFFHKKMLQLAEISVTKIDASERIVLGSTVYVDDEHIQKIREVVKNAREEISAIELEFNSSANNKGKVYHVEIAGFPLSGGKPKKD
jgi:uncharacterized protein (TIGR02147 family)